jgi:hypothetical protein
MLSMFTVTGQVDRETGETSPPTSKVQIMGEMPVKGGDSRLDLITLTVEHKATYDSLKGKRIRVPLGFFAPAKGNIVYYIAKGGRPELVNGEA